VLTRNPENYHAEIEQAHFSPAHMEGGWEASADPVLQSRLFSDNDAARYRLGLDFRDISVNCPFASVANFDRDGRLSVHGNQGSRRDFPDEFRDTLQVIDRPETAIEDKLEGSMVHYLSEIDMGISTMSSRGSSTWYSSASRIERICTAILPARL